MPLIATSLLLLTASAPPTDDHHSLRVAAMPLLEYGYRIRPDLHVGVRAYGVNLSLNLVEGVVVGKGVHFGGGAVARYTFHTSELTALEVSGALVAEIGDYGPLGGRVVPVPARGALLGIQV